MVKKDKGYQIFANIVMILLCVLAVLPFVLLFMSSVTDEQTLITDGYSFFPKKYSLYAYRYLFTRTSSVIRGYILSIIVTTIGTVLNLLSLFYMHIRFPESSFLEEIFSLFTCSSRCCFRAAWFRPI